NARFYRTAASLPLLGHSNLLAFPHLFGFTPASLTRFVSTAGFELVSQTTAGHINPEIRPMTATAKREAARLAPALRRSWIEATFLHAKSAEDRNAGKRNDSTGKTRQGAGKSTEHSGR